jgi:hypothetical protein
MPYPTNPNPPAKVDVDFYNLAPIYFDIETEALPGEELKHDLPPFEAPKTYKDPKKIAAYVEQKRVDYVEKAALSPLTGRVLAIGIASAKDGQGVFEGAEDYLLGEFWKYFRHNNEAQWVGHNTHSFDWPFLIKRSWKLGVPVPSGIKDGRWYRPNLRDTMELFTGGSYGERISLDRLGRYFGVGSKNGQSGAHFAETYHNDKPAAIAYLYNDLALTQAVFERMQ